jgi:electron transfer flavoprotein beta subunit
MVSQFDKEYLRMRILVPVKRVIDPYVSIRVKSDQSGVETQNVKMSMNPFDEIAVEAALQLKEKGLCESVTVVSIGSKAVQETLRTGLALGADEAIHVAAEDNLEPLNLASILKKLLEDKPADLVIMGKQAIDNDNNQTAQYLASLLDWPLASFASSIEINDGSATVVREIDGGLETVKGKLPMVISTDLRLNEPRYATLPNIMKAKKKPLAEIDATTLGLDLDSHTEVLSVTKPEPRQAGEMVDSTESLVDALKNKAKVL